MAQDDLLVLSAHRPRTLISCAPKLLLQRPGPMQNKSKRLTCQLSQGGTNYHNPRGQATQYCTCGCGKDARTAGGSLDHVCERN